MKKMIPSLADLALRYGTISQDQFTLMESQLQNKGQGAIQEQVQCLLARKWATQYQIELLILLRNYHIVRKSGEEFGQIVLEKGFASEEDIEKAREFQKEEFKRMRKRKLIGEILVEKRIITVDQRDMILQDQAFFSQQSKVILQDEDEDPLRALDPYESQFLQTRTLDQEFADKAVEQGFVTQEQVQKACEEQNYQKSGGRKITGLDQILVNMELITEEQRNLVLIQQRAMAKERKKRMAGKEEGLSIEISVLHQKMAARVLMPSQELSQLSLKQASRIHSVLRQIKQKAADQKITRGMYWDSLLFCHLQNHSINFLFAAQDFSSELIRLRQADFLFANVPEKDRIVQRGNTLTREIVSQESYEKTNIFGVRTTCDPELDFTFRTGPGTRAAHDGGGIVADRSGRPFLTLDRKICVFPELHVLEDMDQKYGPAPDAYSDLFVSGIITGDYHVTAGQISAREIRGADIVALDDIQVKDGITDTTIHTQGSVHATYLHNCRIEAFGDVCIKNEMIDCDVQCTGRIFSPSCRVVSSVLCARKGVFLWKIGSERSSFCTVCAGSEQHLVHHAQAIQAQMDLMGRRMDQIREKIERLVQLSAKTFRKMQDVKIFYDKAKNKREAVEAQYAKVKDAIRLSQQKNMDSLISTFETRMNQAMGIIKELNPAKKRMDKNIERLRQALEQEEKNVLPELTSLKQEIIALYGWARNQENLCEIQCSGTALKGTRFRGIYSQTTLGQDTKNFIVKETATDTQNQSSSHSVAMESQYHMRLVLGTSLP